MAFHSKPSEWKPYLSYSAGLAQRAWDAQKLIKLLFQKFHDDICFQSWLEGANDGSWCGGSWC